MIEMVASQDLGQGEGSLWYFMIMRALLVWIDWWKFSILNWVMGNQLMRMKY